MTTLPDVGLIRVEIILIRVVFPAPLGPNMVRNSLCSILRLIFLKTMFVPKAFERFSMDIIGFHLLFCLNRAIQALYFSLDIA